MGTALIDHAIRQAHTVRASTRRDLFGLSDDQPLEPASFSQAMNQLADFGLDVHRQNPGHWILRGRTFLPEIHCYSEREIVRFARLKARQYATTQPEEPHEYADLSG